MNDTTTIRMKWSTRDRLNQLASEAGMSLSDYLDYIAGTQRTQAEWTEMAAHDAAYLREHFDFNPGPEEQERLCRQRETKMAELERNHFQQQRRPTV